jgi:regulator of RNase E activity RraA
MADAVSQLIEACRGVVTAAMVADACDAAGLTGQVLPLSIRPVDEGVRLMGRARTGAYRRIHRAVPDIYAVEIALVDDLKPGEVAVFACAGDPVISPWGELLTTRAKVLGAAGVVTDGAVRDVATIRAMHLPVFSQGFNPADTQHRGVMVEADVPVALGGVMVQPGDVIIGDVDGLVCVPAGVAGPVLSAALAKARGEKAMKADIEAGMSLAAAFARHGLL